MRIVFIGTVRFSYHTLKRLVELNSEIVGVVTKITSPFNSDFTDLTPLCKKSGIPVRYTKDVNENGTIKWILSLNPDTIFCFGWSSLIKKEILKIPPLGVIGFHPAELPQNRGRHPIIWALALGLKQTASTFFFLDEGADSGDILSQKVININYEEDAESLYNKIIEEALLQITVFLPKLEGKNYNRIPQDNSKSNYWRKRNKEDGKIDFRMSSRSIYNLTRALTRPYVGAHLAYKNKEIKIWKVREIEENTINLEPGKVLAIKGNEITVKCSTNAISIIEHEFDKIPCLGEYLL